MERAQQAALPEQDFAWHPMSQAVGNIHHQDASLIEETDDPVA